MTVTLRLGSAYETVLWTSSTRNKPVGPSRLNRTTVSRLGHAFSHCAPFQSIRLGWSPASELNGLLRFTKPAHRHLCLQGLVFLEPMERIERSSVAYRATTLPLSYIGWSRRGYSKPRPPRYECGALPLELLRQWSECGESNSVDRTGDPMPNQ